MARAKWFRVMFMLGMIISLGSTQCPNGGQPYVSALTNTPQTCVTNAYNTCPFGYICNNNLCCTQSISTRCPDGSVPLSEACINGRCPVGYSCNNNLCCGTQAQRAPYVVQTCPNLAQPMQLCDGRTNVCPTATSCVNNVCCKNPDNIPNVVQACPNGGQPVGPCINGQCAPATSCVNNVCCQTVIQQTATPRCPQGSAPLISSQTNTPQTCARNAYNTCPAGYTCEYTNMPYNLCCAPSISSQINTPQTCISPMGSCINGMCAAGYSCNNINNLCCVIQSQSQLNVAYKVLVVLFILVIITGTINVVYYYTNYQNNTVKSDKSFHV